MKRTFKRADGTEETLEGTPEELAEYERKLIESGQLKKPPILKGSPLRDNALTPFFEWYGPFEWYTVCAEQSST